MNCSLIFLALAILGVKRQIDNRINNLLSGSNKVLILVVFYVENGIINNFLRRKFLCGIKYDYRVSSLIWKIGNQSHQT